MKEGIEVDYAQPDIDTIFAYATQLMWGDMGRASMKELGADLGAYGGRFEMDIEAYLDFHRKGLNSVTTGEGTIARNDWNKFQEMSMLEIDKLISMYSDVGLQNIILGKLAAPVLDSNKVVSVRQVWFPSIKSKNFQSRLNMVLRYNNTMRMETNPLAAKEFNEQFASKFNESVDVIIGGASQKWTRHLERETGESAGEIWAASALSSTRHARRDFISATTPLARALFGSEFSRLATWERMLLYYGTGMHKELMKKSDTTGKIFSASNPYSKFGWNPRVDSIDSLMKEIERDTNIFFIRNSIPNDFYSEIFGNSMNPLTKTPKKYVNKVDTYLDRLEEEANRILCGQGG